MKNDLKNIIDKLGNNPLEEQELNKLASKGKQIFEIVEGIWEVKCKDLNPDDYSSEEMEEFFAALEKKVFGYYNGDILKTTDKTKELTPLTFFEGARLKTIQKKLATLFLEGQKLQADLADDAKLEKTLPKIEKMAKERDSLEEERENLLLNGVDLNDVEEWEKVLIAMTRDFMVTNPKKTTMGKNGKS